MGYLITAHVFREKADWPRLAELPASIGYRVYLHRTARLYLLDTFRSSRPPDFPFQTPIPAADIALELPASLDVLEKAYTYLASLERANSFKKSYVNACLLLHRLLDVPVFSFIADDDQLDFACSAAEGRLARLKCRSEDLLLTYDNQALEIAPLVMEEEEDEEFLTDMGALKKALPVAKVLARETPWTGQLHAIAMEELVRFTGSRQPILGLGSFDPPSDEADWEVISYR